MAQSRVDYIAEIHRQLNNTHHYEHLGPHSLMETNRDHIHQALDNLLSQKLITTKQHKYLTGPEKPRHRLLYTLPKIHKPPEKWPTPFQIPAGRPIVSDVNSESYRLSEYLDSFLQPLASSHPSFIKDTFDFIDKITSIDIPENALLVTADVESMYTNIQHSLGLEALRKCLDRNPDPSRPPTHTFLTLMDLTLSRNDFYFDGAFYLQTCGTAMGKRYAPSYANIFMAEWERTIFDKTPNLPLLYLRFLDDIFMIWTHGEEALEEFLQILNSDNPCIKLTIETSKSSLNFLDVTTFIDPDNPFRLSTKVYHKPTDTMQLLHHSSFHPKHTFRGLIKSQVLRFHRLSSKKSDFEKSCQELFTVLKHRGYTHRFLSQIKAQTLEEITSGKPKTPNPRNLPGLNKPLTPNSPHPLGQSYPCNHPLCHLCPHVQPQDYFTSTATNKTYPIQHNLTCQSKNVIYLVTCQKCPAQYVGLTHCKLNQRFWNHRHAIQTHKDTALSIHMNDHDNPWDFTVTPIFQSLPQPHLTQTPTLEELESFFIQLLDTMEPQGMNSFEQTSRKILPIVVPYSRPAMRWATKMKHIWLGYLCQEFPTKLTHRPITALSLGAKNLSQILTRANIRPKIIVD